MAFLPGLKKQFNKANQFMSEKIGGVEGTKLNEEFREMERKTDLTNELVGELINKTKEFLQPNPTNRSKMMLNARVAQNTRTRNYAQPEGLLGESILGIAHKFGENSPYVRSLLETGEAFKHMAEMKYNLEDEIRQDFLEPLSSLQDKELADVARHRKKLESRRLDFDCKKRRRANGANILDEELKIAEEKFEESFNSASQDMHNLLQNDVEQISQLVALVDALKGYYESCSDSLSGLAGKLVALREESAGRQHPQYVPRKLHELNSNQNNEFSHNPDLAQSNNAVSSSKGKERKFRCCVALYDFQAENPGELGFKEGDSLKVYDQIDENWFEGALEGPNGEQVGIFPTLYVRVTQPIPESQSQNSTETAANG